MRKEPKPERKKLEEIIATGEYPSSITELYKKHFEFKEDGRKGNISNRNGLIYLMDIPDTVKETLPPNIQKWCTHSETLLTDFNRWLWNFGLNAPDIETTWKKLEKPKILWSILEEAFSKESIDSKAVLSQTNTESIKTSLAQHSRELETQGYFDPKNEIDARTRIETSIVQRYGQARFREQLLEAYGNRCAITECDVTFALEAAHILPYKGEHTNDVRNGLLLRADVHTLFDLGKLSINPETYCVMLAKDIRETSYLHFHGKPLILPKDDRQRPDKESLEMHFKKSAIL